MKTEIELMYNSNGWKIPNFTDSEALELLHKWGYTVISHDGKGKVREKFCDPGGEVRYSDRSHDSDCEIILAVKENAVLPERVDSKEALGMQFIRVFEREIKQRIMNFFLNQ